jgi:hypothetical protein
MTSEDEVAKVEDVMRPYTEARKPSARIWIDALMSRRSSARFGASISTALLSARLA